MRGKADEYPYKCIDLDLDLERLILYILSQQPSPVQARQHQTFSPPFTQTDWGGWPFTKRLPNVYRLLPTFTMDARFRHRKTLSA